MALAVSTKAMRSDIEPSIGFVPIAAANARILILGSLPGRRSLADAEYYAHPRNAFWRICEAVYGVSGSYDERCAGLVDAGVAVWDVLKQSVRPGSLDADIRLDSAEINDFQSFFRRHTQLRKVCFNGKAAATLFHRRVRPVIGDPPPDLVTLPSTSPAHASLRFEEKLAIWRSHLILD